MPLGAYAHLIRYKIVFIDQVCHNINMIEASRLSFETAGVAVYPALLDEAATTTLMGHANHLVDRGLGYRLTSSPHSPAPVETVYYRLSNLAHLESITTLAAMVLGEDNIDTASVAVNRQGPGAFQSFHGDIKLHPVVIAHLSDEGALDYTGSTFERPSTAVTIDEPDEDFIPDEFETIELSAGDVAVQLHPWKPHRGRNTGLKTRLNIALYTR